ncbi:hypothetical protein Plhal304r1_c030g0097411 [Plasmopara halstedii]
MDAVFVRLKWKAQESLEGNVNFFQTKIRNFGSVEHYLDLRYNFTLLMAWLEHHMLWVELSSCYWMPLMKHVFSYSGAARNEFDQNNPLEWFCWVP